MNGEPWFVATDIANILGYRDAEKMTRMLDNDEKGTHNVGIRSENGVEQMREVTIINESGLYAAILKSRRPEAKAFRKWVTSEVLPSIRKQGGYTAPGYEAPPRFVTGNLSHGADLAVAADRTFRSFLRAGRSAGMALPLALRVANRQTLERTGMDMLAELDVDPDAVNQATASTQAAPRPLNRLEQALSDWLAAAGPGPWRMKHILREAIGMPPEHPDHARVVIAAARHLRSLGMTMRNVRFAGGKPACYWYRPGALEAILDAVAVNPAGEA